MTFQGPGIRCPLDGNSILDAAEDNGLDIESECLIGTCGLDPIRIVSGEEYLTPCSKKEEATLKRLGLEPGKYRMACVAKASGPVVVEIAGP